MKNALFYKFLTTQNALFYKFLDIRMPYFTYFKVFRMHYFTYFREVHTHTTYRQPIISHIIIPNWFAANIQLISEIAKGNSVYFATKPFFCRS